MRATKFCLTVFAAVPFLSAAYAAPTETVQVEARKPRAEVLPDRTIYTLDRDLQKSAGSLGDVLNDLPSVEVDAAGAVLLRGDANVTILIDGKPSPLVAGNRADALAEIPADSIERIEVITNPSAEFKANGSGGIINIITKKEKTPGAGGSIRSNIGNDGRMNVSASGHFSQGPVNLNASYGERRDVRLHAGSTVRSNGAQKLSSQDGAVKFIWGGRNAKLGAGIDIDPQNTIELEATYGGGSGRYTSQERDISDLSDVIRSGFGHASRENAQASFNYRRIVAGTDEKFELELTRGTHWELGTVDYTDVVTATGTGVFWQKRSEKERETETEIAASYVLPLSGGALLKGGYKFSEEANLFDNNGLWRNGMTADWAVDNSLTSLFRSNQAIHAGYLTYENKFGSLGVLGGLRLEQERLSTNLVTTGERHRSSELGFYPSLHLTYALSDTRQMKFSYSRRVNRPNDDDLNPALQYRDAFNVRAGNPFLKSEEIDSAELAYRFVGKRVDAQLSGYVRLTNNGITDVSRYIDNTVLMTTKANLARAIASGIEATLNGEIAKTLSWRLTASGAYNEIDPGAASIYQKQSGLSWNAKAGLDWQMTPNDSAQFNVTYTGKRLLPQGYREPTITANAGLKHDFDNGLAAVFTVNNLFDSFQHNTVLDSPGVHEVQKRSHPGRILYFGFVYTIGAKDNGGENGGGAEEE